MPIQEFASSLGISRNSAKRAFERGVFPSGWRTATKGGHWRVTVSEERLRDARARWGYWRLFARKPEASRSTAYNQGISGMALDLWESSPERSGLPPFKRYELLRAAMGRLGDDRRVEVVIRGIQSTEAGEGVSIACAALLCARLRLHGRSNSAPTADELARELGISRASIFRAPFGAGEIARSDRLARIYIEHSGSSVGDDGIPVGDDGIHEKAAREDFARGEGVGYSGPTDGKRSDPLLRARSKRKSDAARHAARKEYRVEWKWEAALGGTLLLVAQREFEAAKLDGTHFLVAQREFEAAKLDAIRSGRKTKGRKPSGREIERIRTGAELEEVPLGCIYQGGALGFVWDSFAAGLKGESESSTQAVKALVAACQAHMRLNPGRKLVTEWTDVEKAGLGAGEWKPD